MALYSRLQRHGWMPGGKMVSLRSNARTAQTYLAGLGVSGALMAGAIVIFLILVAAVTFDTWPGAGGLLGDDSETIEITSPERPDAAQAAGSALAPATLVVSAEPLPVASTVEEGGLAPGVSDPGSGGPGGSELVTSPPVLGPGPGPGGGGPGSPPSTDPSIPAPGGGGLVANLGGTLTRQVHSLGQAVGQVVSAVPAVLTDAVGTVNETVDHTLNSVTGR